MIFYGKSARAVPTTTALGEIDARIAEALSPGRAIERHAAWVAALIAAGELAQGLADLAEGGADRSDAGAARDDASAAMALCVALARVMGGSWDSGFDALPHAAPAEVSGALARLRADPALPARVDVRRTEGFAHYAVYPESYWRAAARVPKPRPTRVVGVRSIGTVLAAAVGAALRAPVVVTVRPTGPVFARDVAPGAGLRAALALGRDAVWAVADEGPGLSGSSVGATAEALVRGGVRPDAVVLFPSHPGGPGPATRAAHRELWARARRAFVPVEDLLLDGAAPGGGLAGWFADLTGDPGARPLDLAGGVWRRFHYRDEADWPAADRQNERRKYLIEGPRGPVLLRFAGLGAVGREKLARARVLAAAGFGLEPCGLRHGFLAERWRRDLAPVAPGRVERGAFLARVARYLAFRARAFPAGAGDGAPLAALVEMARVNALEALGDGAAGRVAAWEARWAGRLPALAATARPVAIDGRLQFHEWLHGPGGSLLKADALDHCAGHDLVGCQDIAWDVAGAGAEYGLSDAEGEALRAAVSRLSGFPCDAERVALFAVLYPAFAAGGLAMAMAREGGDEARRLGRALARQAAALDRALG